MAAKRAARKVVWKAALMVVTTVAWMVDKKVASMAALMVERLAE